MEIANQESKDMITQDRRDALKLLSEWAVVIFITLIASIFIHEVAHGFGFQLEGTHVSTGFNIVGASGKKPSDADFTITLPIEGMSTGVLLGPFTTWMLAILFTGILLYRSLPNRTTLVIGGAAVANAFFRLMPLAIFFLAAILGNTRGVWQDEQQLSLDAIESIQLPISESELRELQVSDPSMFLGDAGFYFWAIVSISITLVCYVLAFRHLYKLFGARLQSKFGRIIFGLMPLILVIPLLGVIQLLDQFIRINW